MNERLREMVSAVVDGEASDFECRRVLDSVHENEVRDLLSRHYTVRSVVRAEARSLCPPELTASILAAVAAEAPASAQAAVPRWRIPVGGVAVAASVCMAAVFGFQALAPVQEGAVPAPAFAAAGGGTLGSLGPAATLPVRAAGTAVPVGFAPAAPFAPGGALPASANADVLAEQGLRMFMADHVQNASLNTNQGMLPYARVVSYEAR
jgi:sigma-E factor negative regulatory protein RseA